MASFKVPGKGTAGAEKVARWHDQELASSCPALVDWLGLGKTAEGKVRERGTLLLFTEGTVLKGCVTDRESGYRAFVTASGLRELLVVIEAGLVSGDLDWREGKPQGKGGSFR